MRLLHAATGCEAQGVAHRERQRNVAVALQRLRIRLALTVRGVAKQSWLAAVRQGARLQVNPAKPAYAMALAAVLDHAPHGDLALAVAAFDISASQLIKLFARDKEVWTWVQ